MPYQSCPHQGFELRDNGVYYVDAYCQEGGTFVPWDFTPHDVLSRVHDPDRPGADLPEGVDPGDEIEAVSARGERYHGEAGEFYWGPCDHSRFIAYRVIREDPNAGLRQAYQEEEE